MIAGNQGSKICLNLAKVSQMSQCSLAHLEIKRGSCPSCILSGWLSTTGSAVFIWLKFLKLNKTMALKTNGKKKFTMMLLERYFKKWGFELMIDKK